VGYDTSDDAGVYLLNDDLALVQTVDFFSPVVDSPFRYGQIAAANALSDVYAMGGCPLSALSIVCFPSQGDAEVLEQILRGGLDKMREAGCTVVGGHSVRDDDLKFGFAVTGLVHPERVWRNFGARPGDALLLTKSIGTGVIATALKQGKASAASLAAAEESMAQLNSAAATALHEAASDSSAFTGVIHAVTDVTGFGLLGHAREMALPSNVSIRIDHQAIDYLPGALDAARAGFFAGGLKNNREFLEGCVVFANCVASEYQALLFDPQTSGGLMVALAPEGLGAVRAACAKHRVAVHMIGEAVSRGSALLEVI
jgi:selenide,water dikinase